MIIITDDDECALGTATCTHNCEDTPGSYTCNCPPGYVLNTDGRTCNGNRHAFIKEVTIKVTFMFVQMLSSALWGQTGAVKPVPTLSAVTRVAAALDTPSTVMGTHVMVRLTE